MRYAESDRILTLLTRSHGKVRAIAKGVRKTKSRFGGRLEPTTCVSLMLWRGRGGLDTVTQAEILEPFRQVREDLGRFALAQIMLEAADRLVQERESSPKSFEILRVALRSLTKSGSELICVWYLLRLLAIAGFGPSLRTCGVCAGPASTWSHAKGGVVCEKCRDFSGEDISPELIKLLAEVGEGNGPFQAGAQEVTAVMNLVRSYTEYHLERRLKTAGSLRSLQIRPEFL